MDIVDIKVYDMNIDFNLVRYSLHTVWHYNNQNKVLLKQGGLNTNNFDIITF